RHELWFQGKKVCQDRPHAIVQFNKGENLLCMLVTNNNRNHWCRLRVSDPVRLDSETTWIKPFSVVGHWPRKEELPTPPMDEKPDFKQPFTVNGVSKDWKQNKNLKTPEGYLDLQKITKNADDSWVMVYSEVDVKEAGEYTLFIGGDDEYTLWINGQQVSKGYDGGWFPYRNSVKVPLRKGKNHAWAKVTNHSGPYAFSLRIHDKAK
ncbi:MAG: hypothetical protein N2C14_17685, partial [Planctomycetales bacterium]